MSTPKNRRGFTEEWFVIQKKTIQKIIFTIITVLVLGVTGYGIWVWVTQIIEEQKPDAYRVAKFIRFDGNVTVIKRGTNEALSATKDMALKEGDTIQTSSGSSALVEYLDGTKYTIKAGSTLIITEDSRKDKRITNKLQGGGVKVNTPEDSNKHIIDSEGTKVRVEKNSDVDLDNKNGQTTVQVTSGLANLLGNTEQTISADQVAKIDKTGVNINNLPPPPKLGSPINAKEMLVNPGEPIEFVWDSIPNAEKYNLTLASNISFSDQSIKLQALDIKETKYKWEKPSNGPIFWKVQAITTDGLQGKWSEPYNMKVIRKGEEKIQIQLTKKNMITQLLWEIEGNTTPGVILRINNIPTEVDAKGHFKKDVTLSPNSERQIVFEARDPSGNTGKLIEKL
ncbi:MAG: FecR domain-containing protein [Acidobacteria bacterium]|nr:FecR domain-containing protein [Acidobacteriota bacterium]